MDEDEDDLDLVIDPDDDDPEDWCPACGTWMHLSARGTLVCLACFVASN